MGPYFTLSYSTPRIFKFKCIRNIKSLDKRQRQIRILSDAEKKCLFILEIYTVNLPCFITTLNRDRRHLWRIDFHRSSMPHIYSTILLDSWSINISCDSSRYIVVPERQFPKQRQIDTFYFCRIRSWSCLTIEFFVFYFVK